MSSKTTSKCRYCKPKAEGGDRYPGCQDHCEYGIADQNERKARRDKIAKERDKFYEWKTMKFQGVTRSTRRYRS